MQVSGPLNSTALSPTTAAGVAPVRSTKNAAIDQARFDAARSLQQTLLRAVTRARSKPDLLKTMSQAAGALVQPVAMLYCQRGESGPLTAEALPVAGNALAVAGDLEGKLLQWADAACNRGAVAVQAVDELNGLAVISVPVIHRGRPPEAISAVVMNSRTKIEVAVVALQLLSTHVTLWHLLADAQSSETDVQSAAALIELLAKIQGHDNLREAGLTLVSELQSYLQCQRVALGLCRGTAGPVRLTAVSGLAQFDRRTELARAVEAACDEAIIRDSLTVWPPLSNAERHAALAHQRLSHLCNNASIVSSPLRNEQGDVVGALVCTGSAETIDAPATLTFMRFAEVPIGACFDLIQRARLGPFQRLVGLLKGARSRWKWKAMAAAALFVVVMMAVPFPYKVSCDCETQPVVRRFVAAPFDGTLEKTFVRAGDLVTADQPLARLDGREIRWELASLEAELQSESKKRDAALAKHDIAAAQLAKLSMERVELKQRLLKHRDANLEIKSPLDGIVISGEIDRAEGAPLTVGQTLFEIAPLDEMVVEVGIPENEIAYVEAGMQVAIAIDAYPRRIWQGSIRSIHPRSETADYQTVFIAEVELNNEDRALRPGMNGSAKVASRWYPLGWNLFHKAWESLDWMWGW